MRKKRWVLRIRYCVQINKEFRKVKLLKKNPWQKLQISSYLWGHFLVLEHRILIWFILWLNVSVDDIEPTLQNNWNY